MTSQVHVKT